MKMKFYFSGLAVLASLLLSLASGFAASSQQLEQPTVTDYMKSKVGTPDELSPLAPAEARNVRKVGNHWFCDLHVQVMVYNDASARWEPQKE